MTAPRRLLRGIRDKLLLSFSLLIATIAVFVFLFFPARLERQAMRAVAGKAEAIRDMTAYSLSAGLFFGDTVALSEVLRGTTVGREVTSVAVRNTDSSVVVARGPALPLVVRPTAPSGGIVSADGSIYHTWTPVMHDGRVIGEVALGVSLTEVRAEVLNARILGSLVGLVILAAGMGSALLIAAFVTRPLTGVLDTVNRIAAGDLSQRATPPPDVEIAPLVDGFNRMVDGLVGAQAALGRANEDLEWRVEERTREVRAARDELQSLIDLAPQAIIAFDLDWRIARWNQAASRLYGWTVDEVLGMSIPFVPDDRAAEVAARRARLATTGALGPVEVEHIRKDGTRVSVLLSSSALLDSLGKPSGAIAVVTDLTDRKSLELQLRQAQKMEAVGRLAGGVAHDFNNVLTVITMSASLLKDEQLTAQQFSEVEHIDAAAMRATALTRQLLTFSRKQIVKLEPVNLNDVIRDVDKMLRRLLRADIALTASLTPGVGLLVADVTQLQQVILNLAVNASDAMPSGGSLNIDTSEVDLDEEYVRGHAGAVPGRHLLLTVADTGTGMDAATASRIFEPFFTTKEPGRGTGLGLATTYAVVSNLGGHIGVATAPGVGTTFRIYLPIPPESAHTAPHQESPSGEHRVAARGSETVLLVEDEDAVRRTLRRTLERGGYTVLDAADGVAAVALSAAYDGPIDVLVTDLMMPRMNGRDLAEELSGPRPDLRVVFVSGYTDESVNRVGMVRSGRTFLQKPFAGGRLLSAIREVLAESVASAGASPGSAH